MFMGVEAWRILLFIGILIMATAIGRLVALIIRRTIRKRISPDNRLRTAAVSAIARSETFVLVAVAFTAGLPLFSMYENVHSVLGISADILIVLAIGYVLFHLVEVPTAWFEERLQRSDMSMNKMFIPVIRKTLQVVLIILVLIQVIQILIDQPITSIIAGLGIGGLAIALAAQDTLRHFFGSLVLVGDKPFDIGDRIVIDGHDGPVESVDLRSTRIRTLEGHVVTVPNGEMANKTIQNIGKRPYIRRVANVTITYDTPLEKIEEAKKILEDILKDHEGMNPEFPPRVYFNALNADSLNFLMIYWYHPPEYWDYLAFTEKVNLQIMKRFNEAGIDFAFPTQTLYLAGDAKRPLEVGVSGEEGKESKEN